jgi:transcriptional regulator with AAA-type ATPase domain
MGAGYGLAATYRMCPGSGSWFYAPDRIAGVKAERKLAKAEMSHTMQLVIVRRSQFAAFGLLSQAFADEANVRLIWDRRVQDRRGQTASPGIGERRSRDRRRDPSSSWGDRNYLVITRRDDGPMIEVQQPSLASARALAGVRMAWHDLRQDLDAAVRSDLNVLLTGGDPVSREFLARRIHGRSDRRDRPFVVLDRRAAAEVFGRPATQLPCECLESNADHWNVRPKHLGLGGTLLIEEVGDLSWDQQSELLLYLERRAVEADGTTAVASGFPRIITASNDWLFDRIASTEFRQDLFYRLNLIHVVFPLGSVRSLERMTQG